MSHKFNVSRAPITSNGYLRARSCDGFLDFCSVNVAPWGTNDPDYTSAHGNPYTVWGPKLADIGFRKIRFGFPLDQGTIADAAMANYLVSLGIKVSYILLNSVMVTELESGLFPKPFQIENLNEWYGSGLVNGPFFYNNNQFPITGTPRGTAPYSWASGVNYNVGDLVTISPQNPGFAFYCVKAHTSTSSGTTGPPTDVANWTNNGYWELGIGHDAQTFASYAQAVLAANPSWGNVPVTGISFYVGMGQDQGIGLLPSTTLGNLHQYDFPTGNYEANFVDSHLPYSNYQSGNTPLTVTEFGAWRSGPPDGSSECDEYTGAAMMLRTFLYAYCQNTNITTMTYWELCDEAHAWYLHSALDPQQRAGLIYAVDGPMAGAYKQGAIQLKRLFALLSDPAPHAGDGALLPITFSGSTTNLKTVLLGPKSNGHFFLAFWLAVANSTYPEGVNLNLPITSTAVNGSVTTVNLGSASRFGIYTGQSVTIASVTGSGATAVNGTWAATVISPTQITVPVTTTGSGSGGTLTVGFADAGVTPVPITAATNAIPIQITAQGHGYVTGDVIAITGVLGNTAANGTWTMTRVDNNNLTLNGSTGNGTYTSGGTVIGYQMGPPVHSSQNITINLNKAYSGLNLYQLDVSASPIAQTPSSSWSGSATERVQILELVP